MVLIKAFSGTALCRVDMKLTRRQSCGREGHLPRGAQIYDMVSSTVIQRLVSEQGPGAPGTPNYEWPDLDSGTESSQNCLTLRDGKNHCLLCGICQVPCPRFPMMYLSQAWNFSQSFILSPVLSSHEATIPRKSRKETSRIPGPTRTLHL